MGRRAQGWTKSRRRRQSRLLKAYHAKIRRIADTEKVSYAQAKQIYPKAFMHAVEKAKRRLKPTFIETEVRQDDKGERYGVWKRVIQGKPRDTKFTEGPELAYGDVARSLHLWTYNNIVDYLMAMFGKSRTEIRSLMRDMKAAMIHEARIYGASRQFRARDVAAVIIYSDRYQYVRVQYGV